MEQRMPLKEVTISSLSHFNPDPLLTVCCSDFAVEYIQK